MANLYLTKSPLQVLSAIEARSYFGGFSVLVLRYSGDYNNDFQMKKVASLVKWGSVIEITSCANTKLAEFILLIFLFRLKKIKYSWKHIFIGEYRSWAFISFAKILKSEHIFLLDDGSVTIEIQQDYLSKGKEYPYGKGLIGKIKKNIIYFICRIFKFDINTNISRKINLFTCFDVARAYPTQIVLQHNFSFIKKRAKNLQPKNREVWFFGSNISELGLISIDKEISLIHSMSNYYKSLGFFVVYIPHRRESNSKLKKIKKIPGLDVVSLNFPCEIGILIRNSIPGRISSFISTALYTIKKIYDLPADIVLINENMISKNYIDSYRTIIKNYSKIMNVVNVDFNNLANS